MKGYITQEQPDGRTAEGKARRKGCRLHPSPGCITLLASPRVHWLRSSPNTILLGFYGGFITQVWLIKPLAIGDWFESQCPSLFPEVQKLHTFIVLNECWVLRNERWEFLYCMVIKLCSGNHHLTCERVNFKSFRRPTSWNRKRIKHE